MTSPIQCKINKQKPSVTKIVACPGCKKSVKLQKDNIYRPFCSRRCKLIDLGEWASEGHRIPGEQAFIPEDPQGTED